MFDPKQQNDRLQQSLSQGAKEILNRLAERRFRENVGDDGERNIRLSPRQFGRYGRVDGEGRVFDSAGYPILVVNPHSGEVYNMNQEQVGLYIPDCKYSQHRLIELIRQYDTVQNPGWYAGASYATLADDNAGGKWVKQSNASGHQAIWADKAASSSGAPTSKADDWW